MKNKVTTENAENTEAALLQRYLRVLCVLCGLIFPAFLSAEIGYVEPWGRDANLKTASPSPPSTPKLSPLGKAAELIILFHHKVITHIDGPRSHFRPTSSQYMLEAIRSYGFFKGFTMGCDRLLRENEDPWVYRTKWIRGKLYKWDPPP